MPTTADGKLTFVRLGDKDNGTTVYRQTGQWCSLCHDVPRGDVIEWDDGEYDHWFCRRCLLKMARLLKETTRNV